MLLRDRAQDKTRFRQILRASLTARSGFLYVLLASFLFAAGGNAVKLLFRQGQAPYMLAQLRIMWAFIWLVLLLLLARPALLHLPSQELPTLMLFGVVGVAGVQLAYYLTIARLNIAIALLLQYLGLVGVAAWERFRRQQIVSPSVWIALGLALTGSFFVVGAYKPSLLRVNIAGIGFGLLAAALFAFYLLRASALAQRLNRWTILVYAFGSGVLMWTAYDLMARPPLPRDPSIWAAMAVIGLLGTLAPFGLIVTALQHLRPSHAGIVASSEPVFAGVIAFLLLRDGMEPLQLLGAAIVFSGVVLVQLRSDEFGAGWASPSQ